MQGLFDAHKGASKTHRKSVDYARNGTLCTGYPLRIHAFVHSGHVYAKDARRSPSQSSLFACGTGGQHARSMTKM